LEEAEALKEKAEQEQNDPDFLFRWLCQFCGRKNGRHDARCRGCETKKPLRLKREEEAWLEARRVRKEQEEAEQRRVEEERLRLQREEEQKEGTDKAGAWDCTFFACVFDMCVCYVCLLCVFDVFSCVFDVFPVCLICVFAMCV
jgi:ribosomal protein L40E